MTAETIELYRRCFEDCDVDSVKAAVLEHVKTSQFFPTIAEIRERAIAKQTRKRLPEPDELEDRKARMEAVRKAYEREQLRY